MNESQEQIKVVNFLEANEIKFTSFPNTKARHMGELARKKREGWRKGIPDLLIILPYKDRENRLIFIEMKKAKTIGKRGGLIGGGVISEHQKEWIEAINTCKEVEAFVCYGGDEAIKLVKSMI